MSITALAAAMWQGQDVISSGDGHWLMIFAGVAAFALLLQSLVIVCVAVGGFMMQKKLSGEIAEVKGKIMPLVNEKVVPLVDKTNALVVELTPHVREITAKAAAISGHAEEISEMVKEKLAEFGPTISAANESLREANETVRQANETVKDANRRTHEQLERVNGMVTGVLDATAQMGRKIQQGINVPVREVSGIVDGVKTALQTFLRANSRPRLPVYRAPVGTYEPHNGVSRDQVSTGEPHKDAYEADVYARDKPDLEP